MTNLKHLFRFVKYKPGDIKLLLFFARVNASILLSLLIFPVYTEAANKYYYKNDTINIDRVYIYTSLHTQHVSPDDEHVNDQNMLGVEFRLTNKWMYGFTKFDNSFGQESEYLYAGHKWGISSPARYRGSYQYFKLTGGLLHGYKDEYEDKVPFNGLGVAPAIVPTYGYQKKNFLTEVSLGGASVAVVTFGYIF
jgi:hypothetical protein